MKNGVTKVHIAALVLAVITVAAFFPSCAIAEGDFLPRFVNLTGTLDLTMRMRDLHRTSPNFSWDASQYSSIERMKLVSYGYVYDPRFIIFFLNGALGFEQASNAYLMQRSRISQVFDEYDFTAVLLPERPYNLTVFTRRDFPPTSPLTPERVIFTSEGAIFHYRQNPLSLSLSATNQSVEGRDTVDSRQHSGLVSYAVGPFSNEAGYTRGETTSSGANQVVTTDSSFKNGLSVHAVSLSSNVGTSRLVQTGPESTPIDRNAFSWSENLSMRFPYQFSADVSHAYRKDEIMGGTGGLSQTSISRSNSDAVFLRHQLYNSLATTASLNRSSSEATGGDTDSSTKSLSFLYTKFIPIGKFSMGYTVSDSSLTRKGALAIFNEPHPSPVPGSFILNNQALDISTITVMVKDPVTQILVPLTENVNYQILLFGNTVQISVLTVPASLGPPVPSYNFIVSYSLLSSDSTIDLKTKGVNLNFALFDGLFNPYASYSTTETEVVSGTFPGGGDVSTTKIYGYTLQKEPFRLLLERTAFTSRESLYRKLKCSLEYRQRVSEDIDIFAQIQFNEISRHFTRRSNEYSEKDTLLTLTAHKQFASEHLDLYAGGSYMVQTMMGTSSKSYSLYPSLAWHIGKLDIMATISKTFSVTIGASGGQTTYAVDEYFLNVSRKIF